MQNNNLEMRIIKLEHQVSELYDMARISNQEICTIGEVKTIAGILILAVAAVVFLTKIFGK